MQPATFGGVEWNFLSALRGFSNEMWSCDLYNAMYTHNIRISKFESITHVQPTGLAT